MGFQNVLKGATAFCWFKLGINCYRLTDPENYGLNKNIGGFRHPLPLPPPGMYTLLITTVFSPDGNKLIIPIFE